jgi:hypothetical protein
MRRKSSEISEALAAQKAALGDISRRKQANIRRYLARKAAIDEASFIDKTQALTAMLDETRAADPQLRAAGPIGFSGLDDATIIKLKINGGGSTKRFTLCLYRRKTPSVPTPHSYIRATRHAVMPSHSAQAISHC